MTVPRFWREIPQRYNLKASRCGVCESIHYPPREVCPKCRRSSVGKMVPLNLAGRGTVLEWTRVHRPAPGYRDQVPYVIALIRTDEGPVVLGQVVDAATDPIKEGAAVHAVFRRIGQDGDSGVIYYGTKWQVVPTPEGAPPAPVPVPKGDATAPPQAAATSKSGRPAGR